jgi:hypothetical protein
MPDPLDERELENFLRRFEPRRPAPLRWRRRPARTGLWLALAASALLAIAVWITGHTRDGAPAAPPQPAVRPTMAELSVVLRPNGYGRAVEELEGRVLADPRRPGGALRELAEAGPSL